MSIELDFPTSQGRQQLCIGPLACDLDAFIVPLAALGYTRMMVRQGPVRQGPQPLDGTVRDRCRIP